MYSSIDNNVNLGGNQIVTGQKDFSQGIEISSNLSAVRVVKKGVTKGTTPATSAEARFLMYDKAGGKTLNNALAGFRTIYSNAGYNMVQLQAYKPESGVQTNAAIGLYYPATGDPYTRTIDAVEGNDANTRLQIANINTLRDRSTFSGVGNRTTISVTIGTAFKAPADGLLVITCFTGGTNTLENVPQLTFLMGNTIISRIGAITTIGNVAPFIMPARKGQEFKINKGVGVTDESVVYAYLWEWPFQGV